MSCQHDILERDIAVSADGYCPLCQAVEIARLCAALEACAADYISGPCTVSQGHSLLAAEFRRRMEIAQQALANDL